jgi:hypothetical protein
MYHIYLDNLHLRLVCVSSRRSDFMSVSKNALGVLVDLEQTFVTQACHMQQSD